MRDGAHVRCMLVLAAMFAAWPPSANAAAPTAPLRATLPFGCVVILLDVRSGNGARGYASKYVTDGAYAYGEWRASGYGGQSLWRRSGTAWCKLHTGITVLDRRALLGYGLPPAVANGLLAAMHARGELAPPVIRTVRRAQRAPHR